MHKGPNTNKVALNNAHEIYSYHTITHITTNTNFCNIYARLCANIYIYICVCVPHDKRRVVTIVVKGVDVDALNDDVDNDNDDISEDDENGGNVYDDSSNDADDDNNDDTIGQNPKGVVDGDSGDDGEDVDDDNDDEDEDNLIKYQIFVGT